MQAIDMITIDGYKSIRHMDLKLRPLNILIGANGAGKSNFISVFRFIKELVSGNLDFHVAKSGGSETFLHFGRKLTEELKVNISFIPKPNHIHTYAWTLIPTRDDKFVIMVEETSFNNQGQNKNSSNIRFESVKRETQINETAEMPYQTIPHYIREVINEWRIYHFHDTSESAKIKQLGDINDNQFLRSDGSNLAAYLYRVRQTKPTYYQNIVGTIRLMAPFFDDVNLRLDPLSNQKIRLEWNERNTDAYFDAHALSDGTLRFMCLATLLLQPPDMLPTTIFLDEPELGLHPYAISLLASMLQSAAEHTQIIVSTQSVTLVNQFSTEEIIVVEREDGQSVFHHLSEDKIETWLEDYGLGDLWEKNVIGGRPTR